MNHGHGCTCTWCGEGGNREQGALALHEGERWHDGCWATYQQRHGRR